MATIAQPNRPAVMGGRGAPLQPNMPGGGTSTKGGGTGGGQPQRQAPNMFQSAANATHGAMQGAAQGMGYNPMFIDPTQFQNMGNAYQGAYGGGGGGMQSRDYNIDTRDVTAGQLAGRDLSQYFNPYEDQVVQGVIGDLDRTRQMQSNQLNAQATAAGAFGGSRQALMQSELARNTMDLSGQQAGQLRAAGFQNAQQMGLADIGNTMQADLANQGTDLSARQAELQARNQAHIAQQNRQAAGMQAAQSMAASTQNAQMNAMLQAQLANQGAHLSGAQFRLGAANQLGNTGNLGFGQAQGVQQGMAQTGQAQQALQQQLLSNAQGQYQGYTGAGQQGLNYLATALGSSPQESTTTGRKQPGLFDYLTLAAA